MTLQLWAWLFLVAYILFMLGIGWYAQRKVKSADDFATARSGYGPGLLAFAFAATAASGATFIGMPALAYNLGVSIMWYAVLYPIGIYLGVLICLRLVARMGEKFGSRSIPEFMGHRYQSDAVRIVVAVFSLLLLFYLAGQLVAGLVMFERMLGLSAHWALAITALVLLSYILMGGAHADILTDGVQGFLMIVISLGVFAMFLVGFGVEGGYTGLMSQLEAADSDLVQTLHPTNNLVNSPWALFCVVVAHIPLGMLPHIGNKIWALNNPAARNRFLVLAFTLGMVLPLVTTGGLLARVVLGEDLLATGGGANQAIPALFIELMPAWLAALLSVTILSAIMSTADGLVVSTSQVFANDIYRKTLLPRWSPQATAEEIDRKVLRLSRIATVFVLLGAAAMAWALLDMNVALLVWAGIGGMTSALAGPLVFGALWHGATRAGALAGTIGGASVFILCHADLLSPVLDNLGIQSIAAWLSYQAPNPYACSTLGAISSIALTYTVSRFTKPLPAAHMQTLFP